MSKSNPVNALMRALSPRTTAERTTAVVTTESKSDSTTRRTAGNQTAPDKAPKMKARQPTTQAIPLAERDGHGLKHHAELADDPGDDQEAAASLARWEERFDAEVRQYTERSARQQKAQKARAQGPSIDIPEGADCIVAGQTAPEPEPEPTSEPRLQKRGRSATVRDVLRDGMQRISRMSMTQENMAGLTLGDLARSRWVTSHSAGTEGGAHPLLDKLPAKYRRALSLEYIDFQRNKRNEGVTGKERDDKLKEAIAKKFLAMALLGPDSEFDASKIGSWSAINRYLSKHFGLQIEQEPTSARNESSSARSRRVASDFRDQLASDAEQRSRHYQMAWSIDLTNKESHPFVSKVFAGTIEDTRKQETVSTRPGQRTDVTATFQRDFKMSVYEFERSDGSVGKFDSIDEFVAFVGDPLKSGLPSLVSHYACQNLGMFVKNLLFTKTDDKGNPESVLGLYDGTPVVISTSPKASYRLKKAADGTVTLSYRSEVDTTGAGAQGKNTARLLSVGPDGIQTRSVLIEDAQATTTVDIVFHPDGTARMGRLDFTAQGWNQLS